MNPDLTPDQLAAIRKGIRVALQQGTPVAQLDGYLKQKFGLTSADAMKPTGRDADRAMVNAMTLNHGPQLAGALAAITGGDYAKTRDQTRTNLDEASAANPWTMGVTSVIGGAAPAALASMIPGLQPVAGATLANAGRGAVMGAGMGAIAGQGASQADTFGGQMKDAALGAGVGGVLGGAGGAVASKLAGSALPGGNAGTVAREASTLIPLDPKQAVTVMSRQEALAPGSVVLADASPEMQAIIRGIGADPKTAVAARQSAAERLQAISTARKSVGKAYDVLKGRTEPVDPQLVAGLVAGGRKNVLTKGQQEVDLGLIHTIRGELLSKARSIRDAAQSAKVKDAAGMLTQWLVSKEPTVSQLDADYAFLTARQAAAKDTYKAITSSLKQHAAGRVYDVEPGSVGASIPTTLRSTAGTAMQVVKKAVGTDKAARARAVADLLLTPQRDQTGFTRLAMLRDLVTNPPSALGQGVASAGLAGILAPQSAGALVSATQQP